MPQICPECGAPVPEGGTCRDTFGALLLLEAEVPGAPGSLLHFYLVATYGLQHPDSMNFTADALAGLRTNLADVLDGRLNAEQLRRRVRSVTNGPTRVTRRAGDPTPCWKRTTWPRTATYVLEGGTNAFAERVVDWARSVRDALAASE